jgi:hypothetical protein
MELSIPNLNYNNNNSSCDSGDGGSSSSDDSDTTTNNRNETECHLPVISTIASYSSGHGLKSWLVRP